MPLAVVLLAAGDGTRMRSDTPKVLHPLAGAPLIAHALRAACALAPERLVVVTGRGGAAVGAAVQAAAPQARLVEQVERLGTAHAVLQAAPALDGFDGDILVLYGDTPFVRPERLAAMIEMRRSGADLVVLGFEAADPGDYGRLRTDGTMLEAIVEARDASPAERAITLCNSGVLAADRAVLLDLLASVGRDNAKGEFYLTDVVGIARGRGLSARIITCPEAETMGVNSRADLAAAEAAFQAARRSEALSAGVTLTDPSSVWFALDTEIGRDAVIGPAVMFGPGVRVAPGAVIRGFCHFEHCSIGEGAEVGPFTRLRPGAVLGARTRVGNFVEIKAASLEEGAKVSHLSYIGDARVGANANVGAGTIVCNYDGVFKHRTDIGSGAFIGSNSALVAPVRIGDGALVAAGSVITEDVPEDALAVARSRQSVKPGLGRRIMERLRALKHARKAS